MATKKKIVGLSEQTILFYLKVKVGDLNELENGNEITAIDSRSGSQFILKLK